MARYRRFRNGATPYRALTVALFLIPSVCGLGSDGRGWTVQRDLDGDGRIEQVHFMPDGEYALAVRSEGGQVSQAVPRRWKPWKAMLTDADGDGRIDIAVGVYKSTRFLPAPHNCLFVYRWRREKLEPLWLGSALSRPFIDFCYVPIETHRPWPLLAVELDATGRSSLAYYEWNGFGYTLETRWGSWKRPRIVSATPTRVVLLEGRRQFTVSWPPHNPLRRHRSPLTDKPSVP